MKIASMRYRLPPNRYSNDDVITYLRSEMPGMAEQDFNKLEKRARRGFELSGSEYRYRNLGPVDAMAVLTEAALEALEAASVRPEDLDLIIYVGVGRGCLEPASAALVHKRIGATKATAFDVLDACVSWVRGLEIAQALIKTAGYRNVLLVNCEMGIHDLGVTQDLTAENLDLYFAALTISEAATATVLQPGGEDFEFYSRTFSEGFGYCMAPLPNAEYFIGPELPEGAIPGKFLALSTPLLLTALNGIEQLWFDSGLDKRPAPQLTLAHAVSERASREALRRVGLDWQNHFDIHASHGNAISASVPLGMCLATEAGRLTPGTDTLVLGGGAGVSISLCRFTWQA